ncbi:GNAT domain containing protein [Aphelenchoides avenae]|nr:GNAT domain containing protein [Aphelenchus avenae]
MRLNESTVIIGKRCALVPYHPKHVPKYHGWMQDPLLRHQTGSEELTLEEEFDMQAAWRNDEDKLTFIIVSPNYEKDEVAAMVGDINAFFSEEGVELSVMVAEPAFRGQGIASEAIQLMMQYVEDQLHRSDFIVKIDATNDASLRLFEKLHFKRESYSEAFAQHTLRYEHLHSAPDINQLVYRRYDS